MKLAMVADSIWVNWIFAYYLKGKHLKTMDIPTDCSWVFRNILKYRKLARKLIQNVLIYEKDTSLRHNIWVGESPILANLPTNDA